MKRQELMDALMFCLLVTLGIYSRFAFLDWPNFTAVGAVALFVGYYFRSRLLAVAVPLAVMYISNLHESMPGYQAWYEPYVIYGSLSVAVLLGHTLRYKRTFGRCTTAVLLPALCFFLITNFSTWIINSDSALAMYERTPAGLLGCYLMGVPFFRFTLTGDVLFAGLLFGSHSLAVSYGWLPRRQMAYETVR